jgi:predicted DNA-binding transcriptional regulator YafY
MMSFKRQELLNNYLRVAAYNPSKRKTKGELKELLEQKLSTSVSMSSLEHDLTAIRQHTSEVVIVKSKNERGKMVYAYKDKYMSIYSNGMDDDEARAARRAIDKIAMYASMGQFQDIHDALPVIRKAFYMESSRLRKSSDNTIFFEDVSQDVNWYKYLEELFVAIQHKVVLEVSYQPFNSPIQVYDFHPHILKQYNRRWFCFGYKHIYEMTKEREGERFGSMNIIALDRIKGIKELQSKELFSRKPGFDSYKGTNINWADYFDSMVGVSMPEGQTEEDVKVWVGKQRSRYVFTKPIHNSQRPITPKTLIPEPRSSEELNPDYGYEFRFKVVINNEFKSKLFELGADCAVISPQSLVDEMSEMITTMKNRY